MAATTHAERDERDYERAQGEHDELEDGTSPTLNLPPVIGSKWQHSRLPNNLADVFLEYLNDATHSPTERNCRLAGLNISGECKSADECKLSGEFLDIFYTGAIYFLEDMFWAAHGDADAWRRVMKVIDIFDKRDELPPGIERAAEVHSIIHKLRWVTVAHNADQLVEVVKDTEEEFVCRVTDAKENERVFLMELEFLDGPSADPKDRFKHVREQLKESYDRPEIRDLYEEAKQHINSKSTLQSLALDIYLTRHGYIKKDDRDRAREGLRRDLREFRCQNLTVHVQGFDCGCAETDRFRDRVVLKKKT